MVRGAETQMGQGANNQQQPPASLNTPHLISITSSLGDRRRQPRPSANHVMKNIDTENE